jgi:hypothetical protein
MSDSSAGIAAETVHQDSHPNGAENYTMESLFGGQSPLSSAPSSHLPSPHQAVLKLPTIEENTHQVSTDPTVGLARRPGTPILLADSSAIQIDAAQILLSLGHNQPIADRAEGTAGDLPRHDNNEVQLAATQNSDDPMSSAALPSTPTLSTTNGQATPTSTSARKIRLRVSTPMASSLQIVSDAPGTNGSEQPHQETDSRDSPVTGSTNGSKHDNDSAAGSQANLSQYGDDVGPMGEGTVSKQKPARWTRSTRRSNQK